MKELFSKLLSEISEKLSIHAVLLSFGIVLWVGYICWWKQSWCLALALLFSLLFLINYISQNYKKWQNSAIERKVNRKCQNPKWRDKVYNNLRQGQKEILWNVFQNSKGVILNAEVTDVILLEQRRLIRKSQNGYYDYSDDGGMVFHYFIQPFAQEMIEEHIEDYQNYVNQVKKQSGAYYYD